MDIFLKTKRWWKNSDWEIGFVGDVKGIFGPRVIEESGCGVEPFIRSDIDLKFAQLVGPIVPRSKRQLDEPLLDRVEEGWEERVLDFCREWGYLQPAKWGLPSREPSGKSVDFVPRPWFSFDDFLNEVIEVRNVLRLWRLAVNGSNMLGKIIFVDERRSKLDSPRYLLEKARASDKDAVHWHYGEHLVPNETLPRLAMAFVMDRCKAKKKQNDWTEDYELEEEGLGIRRRFLLEGALALIWYRLYQRVSSDAPMSHCELSECERLFANPRKGKGQTHRRFCSVPCRNRFNNLKREEVTK